VQSIRIAGAVLDAEHDIDLSRSVHLDVVPYRRRKPIRNFTFAPSVANFDRMLSPALPGSGPLVEPIGSFFNEDGRDPKALAERDREARRVSTNCKRRMRMVDRVAS